MWFACDLCGVITPDIAPHLRPCPHGSEAVASPDLAL